MAETKPIRARSAFQVLQDSGFDFSHLEFRYLAGSSLHCHNWPMLHLDEPGWVYFVTDGNFIKIGMTAQEDAASRINDLQTSTARRLFLCGLISGACNERPIQDCLQRYLVRLGGEWFHPCAEVIEFIKCHSQDVGFDWKPFGWNWPE